MLVLGVCLVLVAMTAFGYVLFTPPVARVPVSRRIAPGTVVKTPLERAVETLEHLVDRTLRSRGWNPFPARDLELAGINTPQSSVVTAIGAGTFLGYLLGYVLGGPVLGLVVAVLVPIASRSYISSRRSKRRRAFGDQLESTLEVICSALRAGHSFPSALDTVAADAQSPTAEEFARIVNEGRLGRDLVSAMRSTAERMENQDFEWVADAVAVQRDTGGNLSEVLERVGQTIRERNELAKKVRAISAEGRWSAWVMMAVPPALGTYLAFMNARMFRDAFFSLSGAVILGVCLLFYAGGYFWIRKIVTVEV